ncbi:MAG: hypothetical protein GY875_14120, partial [Gammaproteobacteria bacterium]|nr:hypothetical protein [Gammaproteobacteria bacterium]
DQLLHTISRRVAGYLERQGLLERDEENSYLQLDHLQEDPMQPFIGHSVTYRVAIGKQSGQKVFSLQTLPASNSHHDNAQVAKASGFSLHAGVSAQAWEREKLERLVPGDELVTSGKQEIDGSGKVVDAVFDAEGTC